MTAGKKPSCKFFDLKVTDSQRIDVSYESSEGLSNKLWFEFSRPVRLPQDNIAIALSTLCGRSFSAIEFGFGVSANVADDISAFTLAAITAVDRGSSAPQGQRRGQLLSFSGGFDSLAALCLMPEDTGLVSMDFGGRFGREREFFDKFPTLRCSTNVLESGLQRNSWSFMGIGAILTADHTRAEYHTFGSILEAGPDNLRVNPLGARNASFPPFKAAGYQNAPYVGGLTEIGTLIVLARSMPNHIAASLTSLATPGEEKLYRKQILTNVVADRLGINIPLKETSRPPRPHFQYGQNFALDLLSLYVARYAGEEIAHGLVSEMPATAFALAMKLDLTFFERANTTLLANFPRDLIGGLSERLAQAGIGFYTEKDWLEYAQVRAFLSHYHAIVKT